MMKSDKGCSCEDCVFYGESYGSYSNPYDLVSTGCELTKENTWNQNLTEKAKTCKYFLYLIC